MCRTRCLLFGCMLAATGVQAAAAQDLLELSLEELSRIDIRIATGTPKPLHIAPSVATVITAQELEAIGAQDVGAALEAVPGLHVANGGVVYLPRYFIRGIGSVSNPHVQLQINSIPQTSVILGDRMQRLPAMLGMPVKLIQRIEIIRGPVSAVHGADAFAGVINIITKGPGDLEGGQLSVSTGSFDTRRATLAQPFAAGELRGLLGLSWLETEGDRSAIIARDNQSLLDDALGTQASRAPGPVETGVRGYDLRTDLGWQDFRLRLGWRRFEAGSGQGYNDVLDPEARLSQDIGHADLEWHSAGFRPDLDLDARLSYLFSEIRNPTLTHLFPAGASFGPGHDFPEGVINQTDSREENAQASLTALYNGWEQHRLRLGSGFVWADLNRTAGRLNFFYDSNGLLTPRPGGLADVSDTPEIFQREAQRTSAYLFAQDEWAFAPGWELTTGLRHDHYSDFGATTNPRLALSWQTTSTLTSRLLYGEAFRAPAFYELYAGGVVSRGNPALEPEKLRSLELALGWQPSDALHWDLNLYELRIRDFIEFMPVPGQPASVAQNAKHLRGHGLESEWRYQAYDRLQLLANYSRQRTRFEDSGEPLGLVPSEEASLRAVWGFAPDWQLTPQLTWIGERERAPGDPRPALDGYTTFDLTLRRLQPREQLTLALIGRNLFNADVREASRGPRAGQTQPGIVDDLPQAGRSVTLEANVRW